MKKVLTLKFKLPLRVFLQLALFVLMFYILILLLYQCLCLAKLFQNHILRMCVSMSQRADMTDLWV